MRRYFLYSIVIVGISLWGFLQTRAATPESSLNVALIARSGYQPKDYERLSQLFSEISDISVSLNYIPYEKQLEEINKSTSQPQPTYDIIAVDAIWIPELISRGAILPLQDFIKGFKSEIVSSALTVFTFNEKLWAMPHLSNFQLLFYNKAMLAEAGFDKPPDTLEEMVNQMRVLKTRGTVEYPWHDAWGVNKGLIDEYTWLVGAFGDTLFSPLGEPIFHRGGGLEALKFMIQAVENKWINPTSLNSGVLETKDEFITGNCAFNTNWVFQAAIIKDSNLSKVSNVAEVGLLPVSRRVQQKKQYEFNSASVGAFQGLAIAANTSDPRRAWKYIRFLTSPLVQKGFPQETPIWTSLLMDTRAQQLDPLLDLKRRELLSAVPPPRVMNYRTASSIIEKYVMSALRKELDPETALNRAVEEIKAAGITTVTLPTSSKSN